MQILIEPIRWQELSQGLTTVLEALSVPSFKIIPFATNADSSLCSSLKQLAQMNAASNENQDPKEDSQSLPRNAHCASGARPEGSKIAIIGMSGRYPGAEDNEQFWDLLREGLDVHKEAPALRWNVETHVDVTGQRKNTSRTPYGCWLEKPAAFDARFFNMSPREAQRHLRLTRLSDLP